MIPLEIRKMDNQENRKSWNLEIRKLGNQEIRISGNQEIMKSGNLEVRKSGNQEIWQSGNQEIIASLWNSYKAILLRFAFERGLHHTIILWKNSPELFSLFSLKRSPTGPTKTFIFVILRLLDKKHVLFVPLWVRRDQFSFMLPSKGGPAKWLFLIYPSDCMVISCICVHWKGAREPWLFDLPKRGAHNTFIFV